MKTGIFSLDVYLKKRYSGLLSEASHLKLIKPHPHYNSINGRIPFKSLAYLLYGNRYLTIHRAPHGQRKKCDTATLKVVESDMILLQKW